MKLFWKCLTTTAAALILDSPKTSLVQGVFSLGLAGLCYLGRGVHSSSLTPGCSLTSCFSLGERPDKLEIDPFGCLKRQVYMV